MRNRRLDNRRVVVYDGRMMNEHPPPGDGVEPDDWADSVFQVCPHPESAIAADTADAYGPYAYAACGQCGQMVDAHQITSD